MESSKNLPVLVRPDGRGFRAECLLIPDCHAFGYTREGAILEVRRVIALRLEQDPGARTRLPSGYEIVHVPVGEEVLPPSSRG